MQEPPAVDAALVGRIVAAEGLEVSAAEQLAGGVTCHAWRVETVRGALIVRVERADRPPAEADAPRFEAQAGILARLGGPNVAEPIATNRSVPNDPLNGRLAWSIDSGVRGAPRPRGERERDLPAPAAYDLGALLAQLHRLPCDGFGLLEDRRDMLTGAAQDFTEGVLARYADAWPYAGRPLIAHAAIRVAPQLAGAIAGMREPLLRYAHAGSRAVLHGDLNEGNVFLEGEHLGGLIDFSSAWVAPPAFDLASFATFYGWELTAVLLEGYEPRRLMRELRLAEAQQLAIVVALHRIRRAVEESSAQLPRWLAFLEATLPLALRRDV